MFATFGTLLVVVATDVGPWVVAKHRAEVLGGPWNLSEQTCFGGDRHCLQIFAAARPESQ